MKKLILSSALASCLLVTGCESSTLTGATGVDRKQFLMVSEDEINQMSAQNYNQLVAKSRSQGTLDTNPTQLARLQRIANRLIPQVSVFRPQAARWNWQVHLIKSNELNAFCAPGGKIMFYTGIIDRLNLTDDEIAAIMGHEMAHALREHGREKVSREAAQQMGLGLLASAVGLSDGQAQITQMVSQIGVSLPNDRTQESEADTIGVELMARAGYNPQAAISLWKKMMAADGQGQIQLLSTHPDPANRIIAIQQLLPRVMPLYQRSAR